MNTLSLINNLFDAMIGQIIPYHVQLRGNVWTLFHQKVKISENQSL